MLIALEGTPGHYNVRAQCRNYAQTTFELISEHYKLKIEELPGSSPKSRGSYDDGAALALGVYTTVRSSPAAAVGSVIGGAGISSTESSQ